MEIPILGNNFPLESDRRSATYAQLTFHDAVSYISLLPASIQLQNTYFTKYNTNKELHIYYITTAMLIGYFYFWLAKIDTAYEHRLRSG